MNERYILNDEKTPVVVDLMTWARWFETGKRTVGADDVGVDVHVSTVFLGLDHSFSHGPPLLFETIVFGGRHDGYQKRCSTWADAEAQHQAALDLVRGVTA
jgi:hypothetical protein